MTYSRVDVDDHYVYATYDIYRIPINTCDLGHRYERYSVQEKYNSQNIVGIVEFRNGKWLALNDPTQEHRDLIDAIKRTVNTYLRCKQEEREFLDNQFKLLTPKE